MGDPRGFLKVTRVKEGERPVAERVRDYREVTLPSPFAEVQAQASRCMDCGIPFCHSGCPLGNLIPEWNDLFYRGRLDEAARRLLATNNFPEITGRVCPAPCEASCVLNLEESPVTIKLVERTLGDHVLHGELAEPLPKQTSTGRRVAVVGSGPAGLAAAQQLARAGHAVTVFERDDRLGGLLRYGIPDFKLEKDLLDRRLAQLAAEGVKFVTGVEVGGTLPVATLRREADALLFAMGARQPRNLTVPGRELPGIHFAMDFLTQQNRRVAGDALSDEAPISAQGKAVVVIGGGDTGADCVGTAVRQGASRVLQLELLPEPPERRRAENPWPEWPLVFRSSTSHAEGAVRAFALSTVAFEGNAAGVTHLRTTRVSWEDGRPHPVPGSEERLPAELVLLAMGFVGPEPRGLLEELALARDARGNVTVGPDGATSEPGVFAAGDLSRGPSLVVWALADGRRAAAGIEAYLRSAAASRGQ
ncbi:MAG: glutamate synthase subunit beta [Deltaproteobacteria bacterium]|nr:glutamate synthase subunit beta [Deltaproteobacteria bacterium]